MSPRFFAARELNILFALACFAFGVVGHRWSTKETEKFYLDTLKYRIKHGESEKWNKLVESRACEWKFLTRSAAKPVLSWEANESHVHICAKLNFTAIQRFISADQRNLPLWLMWDIHILFLSRNRMHLNRLRCDRNQILSLTHVTSTSSNDDSFGDNLWCENVFLENIIAWLWTWLACEWILISW